MEDNEFEAFALSKTYKPWHNSKRLAYVNYDAHARIEFENKGLIGMQGLARNVCPGWVFPINIDETKIKTAKNGNKYYYGMQLVIFDRTPDSKTQSYRENWDKEERYVSRLVIMNIWADGNDEFKPRYFSSTRYNGYFNPIYSDRESIPEVVMKYYQYLNEEISEDDLNKYIEAEYKNYKRDDRHGKEIYKKSIDYEVDLF